MQGYNQLLLFDHLIKYINVENNYNSGAYVVAYKHNIYPVKLKSLLGWDFFLYSGCLGAVIPCCKKASSSLSSSLVG